MSIRFVVLSTILRGELAEPEPLGVDDQASAYWKWRDDINTDRRSRFELDRIYSDNEGARRMARRIRGLG